MRSAYLEIQAGNNTAQFPIEQGPVTIGRHSSNHIVLSDAMASRSHCVIERQGETFRLRDLNSSNGTKLNGQVIRTAMLREGDEIQIGKTTIRLMFPSEGNGDGEGDIETLTAADLVDDAPSAYDEEFPTIAVAREPAQAVDIDYEQALETLSNSLPDQGFGETDIALVNARGQIIHDVGRPQRAHGRREAVDLFRLLLLVSFRTRATDVHLEPRQDHYQARLRIDGSMVDVARFPNAVGHRIATLVKVISDIDISQRNTIQEGHYSSRVPSGANRTAGAYRRVDYRVSFAPAVFGQKLVIRVLDPSNAPLRATDLNLPAWMLEEIGRSIQQDAGMVLVAGPTGSGKTTSLYALVRSIEVNRRNVVTIEDPVEIQLPGVTQIPVDEADGKSFSALLRSVLRQDPDVILVGEIRDAETARIAMQASITGHLVFSTIHTKDTIGTIFRLLDLGVEPYLVAQGLHLVLAQRLVRQLCRYCKRGMTPTAEEQQTLAEFGLRSDKIYEPAGCPRCFGTGYAGRRAFFELLVSNDRLRDAVLHSPSMKEIQAALAETKFKRLQHSGYQLVSEGVVAYAEIERAVGR